MDYPLPDEMNAAIRLTDDVAPDVVATIAAQLPELDEIARDQVTVERRCLRGGLEAASVERITARYRDRTGATRLHAIVMKRLAGVSVREAAIYERLLSDSGAGLAPRLLGVAHDAEQQPVLFLEALSRACAWPWREHRAAQSVLARVARLHTYVPAADVVAELDAWDYEAELKRTAAVTLERLDRARRDPRVSRLGVRASDGLRWGRRLVDALAAVRQQLLAFSPLGRAIVHGDLHPGNVVVRQRHGRREPVLLDWARARIGSPLEDVSCWLQSLGLWEPEARRRHDTLFVGYLDARGLEPRLDSAMRGAYWLAGASNALSGALAHHLAVLQDARQSVRARTRAAASANAWIRLLRQAHAVWS